LVGSRGHKAVCSIEHSPAKKVCIFDSGSPQIWQISMRLRGHINEFARL